MSTIAVSKRLFVTVPDALYEHLERWADLQGRSVSNLAAYLLESSMRQAIERGEYKPDESKSNF